MHDVCYFAKLFSDLATSWSICYKVFERFQTLYNDLIWKLSCWLSSGPRQAADVATVPGAARSRSRLDALVHIFVVNGVWDLFVAVDEQDGSTIRSSYFSQARCCRTRARIWWASSYDRNSRLLQCVSGRDALVRYERCRRLGTDFFGYMLQVSFLLWIWSWGELD